LKPHLSRTFKVSNDPRFAEKLIDVVGLGLYLDPPEHALALCVEEKSQIQALDRTQKSLPIYPGRCATMTHDYKRNGTTTLFAALDMLEGRLIGQCMPRHRRQEFIKFLKQIDAETPPELNLHLIVDNHATHKHPKVNAWLKRHKRFRLHFMPTSSSWLNLVERWFREITDKRIRRGVFQSVEQLIEAIGAYIDEHNDNPRPFVWTAKAQEIIKKVLRARAALDKIASE
jgi:transposase